MGAWGGKRKSITDRLIPVSRRAFDAERARDRQRHQELTRQLAKLAQIDQRLSALARSAARQDALRLSTPSYVALLSRAVRTKEMGRGLDLASSQIWRYNAKDSGRKLAIELGLRVPELYHTGRLATIAPFIAEHEHVVVKPVDGSGGAGVALLVREQDGYRHVLTDVTYPPAELGDFVTTLHANPEQQFLLEELVMRPDGISRPSYDWKFLCLGGRCELVLQVERNSTVDASLNRAKFWTPDWETADLTHPSHHVVNVALPAPELPEALRAAAETVAAALPAAFVRIDMFEDSAGPVFGEITPHPNGGVARSNYYGPVWDERLGRRWEAAEIALLAERRSGDGTAG